MAGASCHTGSLGRPSRTGGDSARTAVAIRADAGATAAADSLLEMSLAWAERGPEPRMSEARAATTARIIPFSHSRGVRETTGGSGASHAATIVRQRRGGKGLLPACRACRSYEAFDTATAVARYHRYLTHAICMVLNLLRSRGSPSGTSVECACRPRRVTPLCSTRPEACCVQIQLRRSRMTVVQDSKEHSR